ncbi:hypothetical protein [Vibrio fortis]|uniref:hypothetical protein n=1 Tax=Vibrio fortis TaxID=212667 RepID=UPI0038CD8723
MGFKTAKGTVAHYNLEGWDKAADDVTIKFEHVNTFNGLTVSRETMKEDDLETGTEVSAPGKITATDFELSVRVTEDSTVFDTFHQAMIAGADVTLKVFLPVGAGKTILANCNISEVGVPTESGGFLHINIKFGVSGVPALVK